MLRFFLFFFCFYPLTFLQAQFYTSWIVGDPEDLVTTTFERGVVLAGGGTDNDDAMTWMLNRAGGGDVLVLRASGSDGYNDYFYSELGVSVNSVETIRFDHSAAAFDAYVVQRINEAEVIFIAGGDQHVYYDFWKGSAVETNIRQAIEVKGITIGGTSAGMAILGQAYYVPPGGSADSDELLGNPFHPDADILEFGEFLDVPFLKNVITDTHYDQRDRNGRHLVFMARLSAAHNQRFFGIACNEVTAVCIDDWGQARVFGEHPEYDDYAYFLQTNCQSDFLPETMEDGTPITWNRDGKALSVYKVPGTVNGTNTFDLQNWNTGSGGTWEYWYAENGNLERVATTEPGCGYFTTNTTKIQEMNIEIYPNPTEEQLSIHLTHPEKVKDLRVYNQLGKLLYQSHQMETTQNIEMSHWSEGLYLLEIQTAFGNWTQKIMKIK